MGCSTQSRWILQRYAALRRSRSGSILLPYGNSARGRHGALFDCDRVRRAARASLVAAPRRQVLGDVRSGNEVEARVRVRGGDETAAVAVEEELQDGQEPLQIRLLVDCEIEVAVGDRLE